MSTTLSTPHVHRLWERRLASLLCISCGLLRHEKGRKICGECRRIKNEKRRDFYRVRGR